MPTEKKTVGIWTVRMLTKLNNRVKKQSLTFPASISPTSAQFRTIQKSKHLKGM